LIKKNFCSIVQEFAQRLAGHITRVDHTGVNLPVAQLDRDDWDHLLAQLIDKPFKSHTNKLGNTRERIYDF